MILHKCHYCKKSIMDENGVSNSFRIFKIRIKTYGYMHKICFIQYENEKLSKNKEVK